MGYETSSYHMVAAKFYNDDYAAVFLLKQADKKTLKKLSLKKKDVDQFLYKDDEYGYEPDPCDLYKVLKIQAYEIIQAFGLTFEYTGDARFDVPYGYLGLSFREMNDDETKRQFISRVQQLMGCDVEEVHFSYTC